MKKFLVTAIVAGLLVVPTNATKIFDGPEYIYTLATNRPQPQEIRQRDDMNPEEPTRAQPSKNVRPQPSQPSKQVQP